MLKLNMAVYILILCFIIDQNTRINAQFEALRRFSIKLEIKDPINVKPNGKMKLEEKKKQLKNKKEAQIRRQEEEKENLKRKIVIEYLLKSIPGSATVLKDFYSRF